MPALVDDESDDDSKESLSVVTLESGHKLIIRNDSEILVPMKAREKMCRTLHFTHHSDEMMMKQAKDKIFWAISQKRIHLEPRPLSKVCEKTVQNNNII